jgi:hypothetical protein
MGTHMNEVVDPNEGVGRPRRTLRFPADRAVGTVLITPIGSPVADVAQGQAPAPAPGSAPTPQPAQGDVEVAEGCGVCLALDPSCPIDSSALERLGPNALDMLVTGPPADDDDSLAAIGSMTSLAALIISGGAVADEGLAHLGRLTNLSMLVLRVGAVTTAGVAHLARLPKLARLVLTGPVSFESLAPLAEAEALGGLQVPGADEATVEALRDLLPDLTINGVWLSPTARRRLAAGQRVQ